ncbi:uncharacterized protein LOC125209544 [Salvia hispanica]|uniref:uncharacterized protein LOC125209544 n=1 Tax=Salvia hispanica TaxID=49212 RepID=UPI002009B09C|nr:uncharacterized protein LOC125209544 [Salvia hispanica]
MWPHFKSLDRPTQRMAHDPLVYTNPKRSSSHSLPATAAASASGGILFSPPSFPFLFSVSPPNHSLSRTCSRRRCPPLSRSARCCACTGSGFAASSPRLALPEQLPEATTVAASSPNSLKVVKLVTNRGVGLPPSAKACQDSVAGIPADSYSGDKILNLCLLALQSSWNQAIAPTTAGRQCSHFKDPIFTRRRRRTSEERERELTPRKRNAGAPGEQEAGEAVQKLWRMELEVVQ